MQVAQTWEAAAGNKSGMVNRLGELLVESPGIFFIRRLLAECRTFVTMLGGKDGSSFAQDEDVLTVRSFGAVQYAAGAR